MRPVAGRRWLRGACVGVLVGAGVLSVELAGDEARGGTNAAASQPAVILGPQRSSRGRELSELRSRTSRTYVDDSGAHVARVFPGSVNFRDAGGEWRGIDTELQATPGGFRNRANSWSVRLPERLSGEQVRVDDGDAWIAFALRGASGVAEVAGSRST